MNFIIYKSSILYSALYHKRKTQPSGRVYLTLAEFSAYYKLVERDIEEEKNIANSFTYEILSEGEPSYSLNLAKNDDKLLVKNTTFYYDGKTKRFMTDASLDGLKLKSKIGYPQSLGITTVPIGYEKALNIEIKSNDNDEEPSK